MSLFIPVDPRSQSLEFVKENFFKAACFADAAWSLADAGDLAGLSYTTAKLIAHVKAAAGEARALIDADKEADKHKPDELTAEAAKAWRDDRDTSAPKRRGASA